MTAVDFQPQGQPRRRRRRRRHWRRVLRLLGPILLLLVTVLLSLGIVHVIERDVLISDEQPDLRGSFSEAAQRRKWQRRYDDLLREYYGEKDASARGIEDEKRRDSRSESLFLESTAPETDEWIPELQPFQLSPHDPDSEGDLDQPAPESQFQGDLGLPSDLR